MKANIVLVNDRSTGERVVAENVDPRLADKIVALLNDDPDSGRYKTIMTVKIMVIKGFPKSQDRSVFLENVDEDKANLIRTALNKGTKETNNWYEVAQID